MDRKIGFKGFDKIAELKYEQRVFQCDKCENQCDVSEIKTAEYNLFYGDRCERYSGAGKTRKSSLKNLFEEREKILMSYQPLEIEGRKCIGIPRGGLFNEMFPFYATFFDKLGFNIIISGKTNKKIISQGLEKTTAEFCYPFKVAFGHYASINENENIDFVFAPDITEAFRSRYNHNDEIRDAEWDKSYTCPYLQNIGAIVARNTVDKEIINLHLSFREPKKAIVDELHKTLHKYADRKQVEEAFELAEKNYFNFKEKLINIGNESLENLKNKERGVVIVGRPYSACDKSINLNLAGKILDAGFLAIPMDFLPAPEEDLSYKWTNEFSIQGQLILNAANVIRKQGLNAVFLDHFACGPNSFLKHFFAEEIGKPYLTLQIDEHTADAGVVTRLEAFLDSIK